MRTSTCAPNPGFYPGDPLMVELTGQAGSLIANLSDSPQQAVIEANDSGWIHAYEPAGGEAPGFPKFVGQ